MGNRRKRMARRYARRAKISGEEAVTISFGFSSLTIAIVAGVLEELPYVGLLVALLFFHFHRTVLVTDQQVYVYRDLPFHQPGAQLIGRLAIRNDLLDRLARVQDLPLTARGLSQIHRAAGRKRRRREEDERQPRKAMNG